MDRLAREIEFHDQRFADGVGARPQDRFYVAVRDANDLVVRKVAECARQGGAGLEVGCATGGHIEELLRIHDFESTGIDISSAAIRAANARFEGRDKPPAFKVMDANRLEFPDASFDFVYGVAVVHHLELPKGMEEARRVMRPGGRYLFMEPLDTNPFIRAYRHRTPADRSADETPLTAEHLAHLHRIFDDVRLDYFGFLTLAAIPFRRWPGVQSAVLKLTRSMDRLIFKIPGAWRMAWMVVIDARVANRTGRAG
jgi:SAM-dependent methyltransferase